VAGREPGGLKRSTDQPTMLRMVTHQRSMVPGLSPSPRAGRIELLFPFSCVSCYGLST
jgi:hypothetical protein